jgi:hypothetical protein
LQGSGIEQWQNEKKWGGATVLWKKKMKKYKKKLQGSGIEQSQNKKKWGGATVLWKKNEKIKKKNCKDRELNSRKMKKNEAELRSFRTVFSFFVSFWIMVGFQ